MIHLLQEKSFHYFTGPLNVGQTILLKNGFEIQVFVIIDVEDAPNIDSPNVLLSELTDEALSIIQAMGWPAFCEQFFSLAGFRTINLLFGTFTYRKISLDSEAIDRIFEIKDEVTSVLTAAEETVSGLMDSFEEKD